MVCYLHTEMERVVLRQTSCQVMVYIRRYKVTSQQVSHLLGEA